MSDECHATRSGRSAIGDAASTNLAHHFPHEEHEIEHIDHVENVLACSARAGAVRGLNVTPQIDRPICVTVWILVCNRLLSWDWGGGRRRKGSPGMLR